MTNLLAFLVLVWIRSLDEPMLHLLFALIAFINSFFMRREFDVDDELHFMPSQVDITLSKMKYLVHF